MGKISFKDFVDNVNIAKNKLIEHCKENAISVPDNVSFDQVITLNDTINNQTQGFKVTFVDIDALYWMHFNINRWKDISGMLLW